MKSDLEIKEWIDARDVLTKRELCSFYYGYPANNINPKSEKWWMYVLKTKNPVRLKEYKQQKLYNGRHRPKKKHKDKNFVIELLKTEFAGLPPRKAINILWDKYKIKISPIVIWRYRKSLGLKTKWSQKKDVHEFIKNNPTLSKLTGRRVSAILKTMGIYISQSSIDRFRRGNITYNTDKRTMKLREHGESIKNIINADRRFNCGQITGSKLLKNIYNIKINPTTFRKYKKELNNQLNAK